MSSSVHGINAYIKKLEVIAEYCGEKKVAQAVEKDEFVRLRIHMYTLIKEIREGVHERQALMSKRGICQETITKGHECRSKLQELQRSLPQLQQLHKKASGKKKAAQQKDELQSRFQDIRQLKRHVDEVRDLIEGANTNEDPTLRHTTSSAQLLGLRESARGETGRAMNAEEEQALAAMKAKDEQIDRQVGEIGEVVERLGEIATQIGRTAEQHTQQADVLQVGVDKNTEEIKRQVEYTKEIIKYEKNTTMCCQMVLGIVLLCVVGFIFHQLKLG